MTRFCVFSALDDDEGKGGDGISFSSSTGPAWAGSERDYTYDEVGQLSDETDTLASQVFILILCFRLQHSSTPLYL